MPKQAFPGYRRAVFDRIDTLPAGKLTLALAHFKQGERIMRVQFPKLTTRTGLAAAAVVTVAGLSLAPAEAAQKAPLFPVPVPCSTAALVAAVTNAPSGSTLLLAPGCT